jgi:hypothetical protein
VSVPPDQFDENGNPIEPEDEPDTFDEEFVAWREESDPPWWFETNAEIFWQLDNRDSVFLEVQGGLGSVERLDDGSYSLQIHGYDEDAGEDLYFDLTGMDYDELMDFYDYIVDYYDDTAFWPDGGSGDLSGL